jgi:hypothetical protein
MSATLDAIGNQASPTHVAKDGAHRLGQWFRSARDGIMGTASQGQVVRGEDGLGDATAQGRPGTEGNPIAAGIIAFGVGLLVGSLLPPTKVEQRGLSAIADKAEPALDTAIQAVSELGHGLEESTGQAASELGETLSDAGQEMIDVAKASTSETAQTVEPPFKG